MGELRITRNDKTGRIRDCRVTVNDTHAYDVPPGQTLSVTVPDGPATVVAATNRYRSRPCSTQITAAAPACLEVGLLDPVSAILTPEAYYLVREQGSHHPDDERCVARARRVRALYLSLAAVLLVFIGCVVLLPLDPWGWVASAAFTVAAITILGTLMRQARAYRPPA